MKCAVKSYLHEELGVEHGGRRQAWRLALLQRRQAGAGFTDIDNGRGYLRVREEAKANDEANGMKTLLEVVDHHVQLQLAHGADQLLAGALGVSRGRGRDGRGDLNGVVVVVQDLELTQQQGHVGRLLRLHGDLHDGIALVMTGQPGSHSEAQGRERRALRRVAQRAALHDAALQPQHTEDVARRHGIHRHDVAAHQKETTCQKE